MTGRASAIVAVVVVAAGVGVYFMFVRGSDGPDRGDPLAYSRDQCGNGDPANGGDAQYCLQYAYDLMGRAEVKPDDDAARSVLKRSCDHAFQPACDALADFAAQRIDIAEGRCKGSWYAAVPRACVDVGRAYEDGNGRNQSWAVARRWYEEGCRMGDGEGCRRMQSVVPK